MADQGRWFKLWVACLNDPDLSSLSIADFGRWAKLGALTKEQGTNGVLTLYPPARPLCAHLELESFDALLALVERLPHVHAQNGAIRHGGFTVTFEHWRKYQEDSTSSDRAKRYRERLASRPKKRREENKALPKLDTNREIAHALSSDEASSLEANKAKARALLKEVESRMKSP